MLGSRWAGSSTQRLVANFFSLSVLQIANYILPLIILPYLTRILGIERFGLVMFAGAFVRYFVLLTDYGFNQSATKEMSVHRLDIRRVSELFWNVASVKTLIMVGGFVVYAALVLSIDRLAEDRALYFLAYAMVIGQAYFPVWYFLGMENMKFITALNVVAKLIYVVLIFTLVRTPADYVYVLPMNALGFVISGWAAIIIARKRFKLNFVVPTVQGCWHQLKSSSHYFLASFSTAASSASSILVLGMVTSNQVVGYYALAEQLFKALQGMFLPVHDTLYPFMCKARNMIVFRKVFYAALGGAVVIGLATMLLSNPVTTLIFGEGYSETAALVRFFVIVLLIWTPSLLLGYPCLAALGYARYANLSGVLGSAVHLGLLALLIPVLNSYVVVCIAMFSELVVLALRGHGVRKHDLWHRGIQAI